MPKALEFNISQSAVPLKSVASSASSPSCMTLETCQMSVAPVSVPLKPVPTVDGILSPATASSLFELQPGIGTGITSISAASDALTMAGTTRPLSSVAVSDVVCQSTVVSTDQQTCGLVSKDCAGQPVVSSWIQSSNPAISVSSALADSEWALSFGVDSPVVSVYHPSPVYSELSYCSPTVGITTGNPSGFIDCARGQPWNCNQFVSMSPDASPALL